MSLLSVAGLFLAFGLQAQAQAVYTATAKLQLSAFGGFTGAYTGVGLGRNLSVTAGADATFHPFYSLYPSLEIRGTYPVASGSVGGEKNVLGGLRIARHLGGRLTRVQPYGDILFGRGEIDFNPPFPNFQQTLLYKSTGSNVISPGVGANLLLSDHLAFKADFQFQRYASPVTESGSVYAKAFTLGAEYRFGFGGLARGRRR